MAAIPVESSVPEGGPCGAMLGLPPGERSSPTPAGYRDIACGAAGIRVRRVAGFIAGSRAEATSVVTVEAISSNARRASNSHPRGGPPGGSSRFAIGLSSTEDAYRVFESACGIKNQEETIDCADTGAAQSGVPPFGFALDSYCCRA